VTQLPLLGNVTVGYRKEPMGFEQMLNARCLSFMERAPGIQSFFLRSPGMTVFNQSEELRLTWAGGIYHDTENSFGYGFGDGRYAETGRLPWLPWYVDGGRQLLHLGAGASHRHLVGDRVRLRGRPSVRSIPGALEPPLADTGTIQADTQDVVDYDLQSHGLNGATLHDEVLGLNWFLNPHTKVQWNLEIDYRTATPSTGNGFTYIFGTRMAVDF
jgi:phosphate-selective porin